MASRFAQVEPLPSRLAALRLLRQTVATHTQDLGSPSGIRFFGSLTFVPPNVPT